MKPEHEYVEKISETRLRKTGWCTRKRFVQKGLSDLQKAFLEYPGGQNHRFSVSGCEGKCFAPCKVFLTRRADVALARRVIHSGGGSGSGVR